MFKPSAELKRCTNVTAPHCDRFNPSNSRARRLSSLKTARTKMFKMSVNLVGHLNGRCQSICGSKCGRSWVPTFAPGVAVR